jgi:hypothetical protein
MNPHADFDKFFNENLPGLISSITSKVVRVTEANYPNALIHQLFRNYAKCNDLKTKLETTV